jgi:hypothetical protein
MVNVRRNYGHHFKQSTMNDLPLPNGDFFAEYARKQRKYNTILAVGILSTFASLYTVRYKKNQSLLDCMYFIPISFLG